ncbi:mechanosensitive ion channel family protein [Halomicroarcula sp. F13]|uniref:Mechanosensitive ion channel family protein n=1 Tax=Haloarcula rubra TaxID=2487747 RepID=A0AAW4PSY7_9EURY|nr:mechanosensitive ion channel family protein [Halomicroarcula rubra]MBX0324108.1 mechanosensitive ion channel family protein [Halomicroarcula rubra]
MVAQLRPPSWLPDSVLDYSQSITEVFVFLAVTGAVYLLGRVLVVPVVIRVVRSRNKNNPTLVTAMETYLQVTLVGLAGFVGLVGAGHGDVLLSTDSAILVAALTFAFGVAGQEVLGSLVSGFFLVADPDFNVGDWISWPGGEGVVEAVDFRVTRVRSPNNETITVPNTELTTNALVRPFGRDTYRVTEQMQVAYEEDTERALFAVRDVAGNHDRVVTDPEPTTRILDLGPDAITVQAEFWIDDPARGGVADVRSDFRRRVKRRFDEEGLILAPPSGRELSGSVQVEREATGD